MSSSQKPLKIQKNGAKNKVHYSFSLVLLKPLKMCDFCNVEDHQTVICLILKVSHTLLIFFAHLHFNMPFILTAAPQ